MEWNFIGPTLVMMTLILTTGGVLVVRPLTRRLGELLGVIVQQKRQLPPEHEVVQLRELVATLEARLSLVEERQAFTEALLSAEQRRNGHLEAPAGARLPR